MKSYILLLHLGSRKEKKIENEKRSAARFWSLLIFLSFVFSALFSVCLLHHIFPSFFPTFFPFSFLKGTVTRVCYFRNSRADSQFSWKLFIFNIIFFSLVAFCTRMSVYLYITYSIFSCRFFSAISFFEIFFSSHFSLNCRIKITLLALFGFEIALTKKHVHIHNHFFFDAVQALIHSRPAYTYIYNIYCKYSHSSNFIIHYNI